MISETKVRLKNTSKLCELIDFYLYSESFKKLSGAAQQDYESCLVISRDALGHVRLKNLTGTLAQDAYNIWLTRGIYRANKIASVLSIVLNKGVKMGLHIVNPMPHIDRETNPARKVTWTPEQVNMFLTTAYKRWRWRSIGLIMQMAYEWGQRVGDMRMLTWTAINFDKKRCDLEQSKRGESVHLPISDPLMHVLKQQHETFGFQCLVTPQMRPQDGAYKPYSKETLFSFVNQVKAAAGLPDELTAMDMRRSAITEMAEAGVSIATMKQVTGHTNINSLTPYIKHTYSGASEALAQRQAHKDKE